MKRIVLAFSIACISISAQAQTITLGPIAKSSYCIGDTLYVPYTATGNFASDNHFFLELSDANGSFTSFKTIGSRKMLSSIFSVPMTEVGSHYRVKVASTDPFAVSNDNGTDIAVVTSPKPNIAGKLYAAPNQLVTFQDIGSKTPNTKYLWSFGQDASKPSDTAEIPAVSWATEGTKEVTVKIIYSQSCVDSLTEHYFVHVITCSPTIPSTARIVTGIESGSDSIVWVKAGASYESHGFKSAFVESGGSLTVVNQGSGILYLKSNVSFAWQEQFATNFVVVSDTSVPVPDPCRWCFSFVCKPMTFSYTPPPPPPPPPPALVESLGTSGIRLHQVANHVFVSAETNLNVSITNILGSRVLGRTGQGLLDIDLSALPSGVYFTNVESEGRREIRRIIR